MTNEVDAQSRSLGITLGFTAYIMWGLLTLYWKVLKEFDPFELIGWRIATSVVVLIGVVVATGRTRALVTALRDPKLMEPAQLERRMARIAQQYAAAQRVGAK